MASLSQLEAYTNDLNTATKTLASHCRNTGVGSSPYLAILDDAPREVHRARRKVLSNVARLQTLLAEPGDFIQHLASQVRHLSYFQVVLRLKVWDRINSSLVCSGWANSRYLHASRSVAAFLLEMLPTLPACQRRNCVVLCG